MVDREIIERFVNEMRRRYAEQIAAVSLPNGTREYVEALLERGDPETIEFLLKLSYLMGLHTGFAAANAGARSPDPEPGRGPLQA
ncbi:MAG: hypothetical protein GX560_03440 [Deinococcales bacterium]|nr:hypothetical protein [Deinococcales bacterium]